MKFKEINPSKPPPSLLQQQIEMENKERSTTGVSEEPTSSEMKKVFAEMLQEDEKLHKKREETEAADKSERVLPVGLTAKIDYINKFLRRIKQLSKDPTSILNDSKGINLSRYISEVAQNLLETRLTIKDVGPILDLTSLLHQRYDDFVLHLVRGLLKAYKDIPAKLSNMKPKVNNSEIMNLVGRRKAILKLLTDLYLQGYLKEYKNIYSCMRELMQVDAEKTPWLFSLNLQTIASYLKMYQWTLFRWLSSTRKLYLEKLELTQKFKVKPGLLPEKRCAELRIMFAKYYKMRALKYFEGEFKEMKEAEFFFQSSDQEKSEKDKIEAQ